MQNNQREKIGHLTGRIEDVLSRLEALQGDNATLREELAGLKTDMQVHIAYHRAEEKRRAEEIEAARASKADMRWTQERLIQVIITLLSAAMGSGITLYIARGGIH